MFTCSFALAFELATLVPATTGGGAIELGIAFLTLCALEIVLGIDNVIFISLLASKLPKGQQAHARFVGLSLAMVTRILLLLSISWVVSLTKPIFTIMNHSISGRDLILLLGGLFLIGKSTHEIHSKIEGSDHAPASQGRGSAAFTSVIFQIIMLDIVFSLDSVITAVGMVNNIPIMVAAIVVSVIFMMIFAGTVSSFIERHPTLKMLALSFLLLIGVMLLADGFGQHIPRGYIYVAMGFSVFVEFLNIKARATSHREGAHNLIS